MRLRNLACVFALAGCGKPVRVHEAPAPANIAQARAIVQEAVRTNWGANICAPGSGCEAVSVVVRRSFVEVVARQKKGTGSATVRYPFDVKRSEYQSYGALGCVVMLTADYVSVEGWPGWTTGRRETRGLHAKCDDVGRVLGAYNALVESVVGSDEDFAKLVEAWRAANPKPPLSESGNKHRVLAENAFREKNVASAIEHFEAALESDPTWPEGNFNLALLYGETGEFAPAARHMKRYLLLLPDSKDAKAANEKIIIWEDKAKNANP